MSSALGYLHGTSIIYELEDPETQIGRAETNDIVLHSSRSISSNHSKIVIHPRKKQTARLVDLNSMNACFVNDTRVHNAAHELHSGDVIRFGYDNETYRFYFPEDVPAGLLGEVEISSPSKTMRSNAFSPSEGARRKREDLGGYGVSDMFSGFQELNSGAQSSVSPSRRSRSAVSMENRAPAGLPSRRPHSASSTTSRKSRTLNGPSGGLGNSRDVKAATASASLDLMPSLRGRAGMTEPRHRHERQAVTSTSPPWRDPSAANRFAHRDIPVSVLYPQSRRELHEMRASRRFDNASGTGPGAFHSGHIDVDDGTDTTPDLMAAHISTPPADNHSMHSPAHREAAHAQEDTLQTKAVSHHQDDKVITSHDTPSTRFGASPDYKFPVGMRRALQREEQYQEFEDSLNATHLTGDVPHFEQTLDASGTMKPIVCVADFDENGQACTRYPPDTGVQHTGRLDGAQSAMRTAGGTARPSPASTRTSTPHTDAVSEPKKNERNGNTPTVAITGKNAPPTPNGVVDDAIANFMQQSREEGAALREQVRQLADLVIRSLPPPGPSSQQTRTQAARKLTRTLEGATKRRLRQAFFQWLHHGEPASDAIQAEASAETVRVNCMSPPRPTGEPERGFYISTCSSRAKGIPDPDEPPAFTRTGSRGLLHETANQASQRPSSRLSASDESEEPKSRRSSFKSTSQALPSLFPPVSKVDIGVQAAIPTPRVAADAGSNTCRTTTPDTPASKPTPFASQPTNASLLLQDVVREVNPRLRKAEAIPTAQRRDALPLVSSVPRRTWSRPLYEEIQRLQRIPPTSSVPMSVSSGLHLHSAVSLPRLAALTEPMGFPSMSWKR